MQVRVIQVNASLSSNKRGSKSGSKEVTSPTRQRNLGSAARTVETNIRCCQRQAITAADIGARSIRNHGGSVDQSDGRPSGRKQMFEVLKVEEKTDIR